MTPEGQQKRILTWRTFMEIFIARFHGDSHEKNTIPQNIHQHMVQLLVAFSHRPRWIAAGLVFDIIFSDIKLVSLRKNGACSANVSKIHEIANCDIWYRGHWEESPESLDATWPVQPTRIPGRGTSWVDGRWPPAGHKAFHNMYLTMG